MGVVDMDVCMVCGKEREGLKHIFFYYEKLTAFIDMLKRFLVPYGMTMKYVTDCWELLFLFDILKGGREKGGLRRST